MRSKKETVLLEGKNLAQKVQDEIKKSLEEFKVRGWPVPQLVSIQVGDNASSDWYLGQQKKLAEKLGIGFRLISRDQTATPEKLIQVIRSANQDAAVAGIFLTMPLPEGYDPDKILLEMDLRKDVEGIHPANLGLLVLRRARLIPPTAFAAFKLIESTGVMLRGKKTVLVGQSAIVGRPLQLMLGERRVTTLVCNSGTSDLDMAKYIANADIVVGCAGQPGLVKGEWIKKGSIVIDVGTTEVGGKLCGDVGFDAAKDRAGFITPVPGGVGPLTVTMLLDNLIRAYQWQKEEERR